MKKIFLFGLAVVLITSCQQNEIQRWARTSAEVDVTKALVKDYEDGNWTSWLSHYADSAKVFHNTIIGATPQQLQDALKNDIQKLSAYGFSENDKYYEMIIDDHNEKWVYFWGIWEAKVAGTDKDLIVPVHLALQFVDGKIVREFGYYDYSSIMMAFNEKEAVELSE